MTAPDFNALRQCCTRNPGLKFLSLLVAVCIWGATTSPRQDYVLSLPVHLQNIPDGYAVASQPPREVRFTLSGPVLLLASAQRTNTVVSINLQNAVPGTTLFPHLESALRLPEGIKVTGVSPAALEISLARTHTRPSEGEQQP